MNSRGTIFCQFGEYANHVGSHFWNIQQQQYLKHKQLKYANKSKKSGNSNQIDNNLLFRKTSSTSSSDISEKVITPRVVIVDFKDNLGNLKKVGYLFDEENITSSKVINQLPTWDQDKVEIIREKSDHRPTQFFKSLFPSMDVDQSDAEENEYYENQEHEEDESHDTDESDEAFYKRQNKNLDKMAKQQSLDYLKTKKTQIFNQNQQEPKEKQENSKEKKPMCEKEQHFRMIEDLSKNSKTWTDFLKPDLHPRTIYDLKKDSETEEDPETEEWFWNYNHQKGVEYFEKINSKSDDDSLEEQLHFLLEESDSVNSFQILTDAYNGWGGFTGKYIEDLILDFVGTKTAILTFGTNPYIHSFSSFFENNNYLINCALSMADLYSNSSMFVPLSAQYLIGGKETTETQQQRSFEYLKFFQGNRYESSAVFASALNTVVQPMYKKTGYVSMNDLLRSLAVQPALKMGILSTMMPFPILDDQKSFFDILSSSTFKSSPIHENAQNVALCPVPMNYGPYKPYSLFTVLKGIKSSTLGIELYNTDKTSKNYEEEQTKLKSYAKEGRSSAIAGGQSFSDCKTFEDMWDLYVSSKTSTYFTQNEMINGNGQNDDFSAFSVPESFPHLFDMEKMNENGKVVAKSEEKEAFEIVKSFAHCAQLEVSSKLHQIVKMNAKTLDDMWKKNKSFVNRNYSDYTKEDWMQKVETLFSVADAYDQ